MMGFVTGIFGIAGVTTFLGILLWWIKAPPLIIIVAIVLSLLVYDLVLTLRQGESKARR